MTLARLRHRPILADVATDLLRFTPAMPSSDHPTMAVSMSRRCLRLNLRAGEALPTNLCWRIEKGYLWLARWRDGVDPLTLGLWGPGERVVPELIGLTGLELRSLTPVVVDEEERSAAWERACLEDQLRQAAVLLLLSHVRPAESRLLQLLEWLAGRFGTSTGEGVQLSFGERLLTHQQLADIAGVTRVTVTKALAQFRQSGVIARQDAGALLLRIRGSELRTVPGSASAAAPSPRSRG